MKLIKSYRQWIPLEILVGFGIAAVILYFPWAIQLFKIHWLALLVALVIAGCPLGQQRLAAHVEELPRYRVWAWLCQIVGLQLCFGAVFLGISTVCGKTAPVLTTPQSALWQLSLTQLLVSEGLFPWGFFVLIAVGVGYYAYCQRQDAYLATTVSGLISNSFVNMLINFIPRLVTFVVYGITFGLLALLGASIAFPPIITGFSLAPMLVSLSLLLLCVTKIYRRNLKQSLGKKVPLIAGLFLTVIAIGIWIWLANGLFSALANVTLAAPTLLNHWMQQPWSRLWLIFANSWWMLWTPLIGVTLARMSRGYKIREMIAATLGFPFMIAIILGFTRHFSWDIAPVTATIIAGIGLLGLLFMTLNKKALPSLILVYLPRQDHYKFRSYGMTFVKITQIAAGFLFIYLPSGMLITHFFLFALALPLIIISLIGMLALFRYFNIP